MLSLDILKGPSTGFADGLERNVREREGSSVVPTERTGLLSPEKGQMSSFVTFLCFISLASFPRIPNTLRCSGLMLLEKKITIMGLLLSLILVSH